MTTYLAKCFGVTAVLVLLFSGQIRAMEADLDTGEFFDTELVKIMRCDARPFALGILLYLQRAWRIDVEKREWDVGDGESCWRVNPSLSFRDNDFFAVCVSTNDLDLVRLFPKFYWRGPGATQYYKFSLVSRLPPNELAKWAQNNLPRGKYEVGVNDWGVGSSELKCSKP